MSSELVTNGPTSEPAGETDTLANGPTSNDQKVWLHAWNSNELRQNSADWNLAADAGLLKYLQEFSTNFMAKAHESTLAINNLVHETCMTETKMRSVADRFLTLSDSQFIENRVYDEDVSEETNAESKEKEESDNKVKEQTEIDALPKLREAIQSGIKVLDDAFDVLDANAANSDYDSDMDSDAEDGQGTNNLPTNIYEPKDPYVTRPLPHLIGSRGFQESEDVGIKDLPSEDEIQDDQGSISESDEEVEKPSDDKKDSITSSSSEYDSDSISSDSDNEKDIRAGSVKKTKKASFTSDSQSDNDLFGKKNDYSSSEDENSPAPQVKPPKKDRTSSKISKKKKTATKEKDVDLFGSNEEDGDDLFANAGGLFGAGTNLFDKKKKSGGLFDDVDIEDEESDEVSEEDEIRDNKSQTLSSEEEEKSDKDDEVEEKSSKPLGGVSMFSGAMNKELLSKLRRESDTTRSDTTSQHSEQYSTKKGSNLFLADEEEDNDDDLFAKKAPSKQNISATSKPKSKSFLESSSDSENEKPPPMSIKADKKTKKPASDLFGDDSSDDDFFAQKPAPKKPVVVKKPEIKKNDISKSSKESAKPTKPSALDSSSDDDSMFSNKPPPVNKTANKSKGLFDSESDDDFFSSMKTKPKPPVESKSKPKDTGKTKETAKPKTDSKAKGLFDSDSDDDFTGAIKPKSKSKDNDKVKKKSLLSDGSDSDDLFSPGQSLPVKKEPESNNIKNEEIMKSKSDSLFSAESGDESEKEEIIPPKKKPAGAVAMFGGGFGGAELSAAISKRRSTSEISNKSSSSADFDSEKGSRKTSDASSKLKDEDKKEDAVLPTVNETSTKSDETRPIVELTKPVIVPSPTTTKKSFSNATAKPFKPFGNSPIMTKSKPVMIDGSGGKKSVNELRAGLSFNPSTLLPGAVPKPKPNEKTEVSFDKPPVLKTLESVNKTRARGQANRRPPSRHGKSRRPVSSPPSTFTSDILNDKEISAPKPPLEDSASKKQSGGEKNKPNKISESKEQKSTSDIFQQSETPAEKEKPQTALIDSVDIDAELFSGSLFSKSKSTKSKTKAPKLFDDDDIFGDTLKDEKSNKEKKSAPNLSFNDDVDELFEDLNITGGVLSKNKKKPSKQDDIFGDDSEKDNMEDAGDIFGKTNQRKTSKRESKLPSDDDIFGDILPEAKPKSEKTKKVIDDMDIFGDELDFTLPSAKSKKNIEKDLFADDEITAEIPPKKSPKAQKKKTAAANNSIFDDDIFAETLPQKKTKKSEKKAKASKAPASCIFDDDDVADIFQSTSNKPSGKPKKATTTKKNISQPEKAKTATVTDDPLGLF
uniref:WASH complex subunit 2C-like n=1 Tax=Styela clava TaxID=7725 RepID=UPI001939D38C|nr:WASH complex subunit 2C-like [Styela clava]